MLACAVDTMALGPHMDAISPNTNSSSQRLGKTMVQEQTSHSMLLLANLEKVYHTDWSTVKASPSPLLNTLLVCSTLFCESAPRFSLMIENTRCSRHKIIWWITHCQHPKIWMKVLLSGAFCFSKRSVIEYSLVLSQNSFDFYLHRTIKT